VKAEDILFSIPFPVAITDGEGRIISVNQKFEILVNRSFKYLEGKKLSSFFRRAPDIDRKISEAFSDLVEVLGFRDGQYFLNFAPFFISSEVKGVIVVVQPAPESPFEKDIVAFLKGLSHEIRNPLSGIKGAAKCLKELKLYDEELVSVLIEETERIERLLNNVVKSFDFSVLSLRKVNIHKIIQLVVKLFEAELRESSVNVVYDFDPSLPEILLDPDRMTQAFINVFKNALEAVAESPKKEVRIETGYAIHPSGFVFIRVRDTGVGMSEEELANLFLPFYTTKEKGSGLGAFITGEIVRRHGGEIRVKSEKGKGTEVTILLPMKRGDGEDTDSRR